MYRLTRILSRVHVLALCLLLSGCGLLGAEKPAEEPIRLLADASTYEPGDAVTFTLINGSEYEIGYNLCFSRLERNTSKGWEEFGRVGEDVCLAVQHNLSPGSEAHYEKSFSDELQDGEYRISTGVTWETGESGREESHDKRIHTDSFTIERK